MPTTTLPAFNGCAPPTNTRRDALAALCRGEFHALTECLVSDLRHTLDFLRPNVTAWLRDAADSAEGALRECGEADAADGIPDYERIKHIVNQTRSLLATLEPMNAHTRKALQSLLDANRCPSDTRFGILSVGEVLAIEDVLKP